MQQALVEAMKFDIEVCFCSHTSFPHLMYSFLIVGFSGINLALLAQASCVDLILFMNISLLSC